MKFFRCKQFIIYPVACNKCESNYCNKCFQEMINNKISCNVFNCKNQKEKTDFEMKKKRDYDIIELIAVIATNL